MKNMIIIISFVLLTILPLKGSCAWMRDVGIEGSSLWAMAGGSKKPDHTQEIGSSREAAEKAQSLNVIVKVKTNKDSYQTGEPVRISMEVMNGTGKTVSAYYPSSQKYDFIVSDKDGAEVWRWSYHKMFLMEIIPFQLKANEKLLFHCVWDQRDNSGNPIPAGEYSLSGEVKVYPRIKPEKEKIVITEGLNGI